jgi:hypothetical protein
MSAELMRSYLDILNEQNQLEQLDEGVLDTIIGKLKPLAQKAMQMIGMDAAKEIAAKAQQATGGNLALNKDNALRVAQALGVNANAANQQAVSEGIAGNWQGKLIQLAYTLIGPGGMLGGLLVGPQNKAAFAAMVVGFIALIFAQTFYADNPGQVGAMGKYGNKGMSTQMGKDDETGEITRGQSSSMGMGS